MGTLSTCADARRRTPRLFLQVLFRAPPPILRVPPVWRKGKRRPWMMPANPASAPSDCSRSRVHISTFRCLSYSKTHPSATTSQLAKAEAERPERRNATLHLKLEVLA